MKKLLTICILLALVATAITLSIPIVEAETSGDYTYTEYGYVATITDYTGSASDLTIPSTLDGYPVVAIDGGAFSNCKALISVTIPDSVTTIEGSAFNSCSSLTSVTIGSGVTELKRDAFINCPNLAGIWVSEGNAYYSSDARGVLHNKNKTALLQAPYAICGNYTIPNSVTTIYGGAFSNCKALISVTIPDSVTTIEGSAFDSCSSLTSVTIPDSVTTIGYWVFEGCSSLTSIWVDENNPNYSSDLRGVLFNKDKTTLIVAPGGISGGYTIPDSVTVIDWQAFDSCSSLTSVIIPDSVTAINSGAFENCTGLTRVTFGNGVEQVGVDAFYGCTGLKGVYIRDLGAWCSISFGDDGSPLYYAKNLYLNNVLVTDVVVPDSVTRIGEYAFSYCTSLTGITIPGSVKDIGHAAFEECKNLSRVSLGDGLVSIGGCAFYNCQSLTQIAIPDSVISIGRYAFEGSTNIKFQIYKNMKYLGNASNPYAALIGINADNMTDYTIHPDTRIICGGAFHSCSSLTQIVIPDKVVGISAVAFFRCSNLSEITILGNIVNIGDAAFWGCKRLTGITIPDSVTDIGDEAFFGCESLTDITIPDGITVIGVETFRECSGLTSIVIPDSVTTIGAGAFNSCSGLTSVTIGNGVNRVGGYAFCGCTSLKSVYISDLTAWCEITFNPEDYGDFPGETTIANPLGNGADLYLNGELVTDLVVPDGITGINGSAFEGCTSLVSVTVPDSVTDIGPYAFSGCTNLTCVTILASDLNIDEYALRGTLWHVLFAGTKERWERFFDGRMFAVIKHFNYTGGAEIDPINKTCSICSCSHTWDAGVVIKEATCNESGVAEFTCPICQKTKQEEVPMSTVHTPGADATDTTPQICVVCGLELKPAIGTEYPTTEPDETEQPETEPTTVPEEKEQTVKDNHQVATLLIVIVLIGGAAMGVILWKKKQ